MALQKNCSADQGNTSNCENNDPTSSGSMDENAQQLANLVASSLNNLGELKDQLSTLQQSQVLLLQNLVNENSSRQEVPALYNLSHMFDRVAQYTQKAHKLGHDMNHLLDRTDKLKERANRLVRESSVRAEQQAKQRVRQEERERLLIARPAWQTQTT